MAFQNCPKCGSEFVSEDYGGCDSGSMSIECQDCGHRLVGTDYEKLSAKWNAAKRPNQQEGQ